MILADTSVWIEYLRRGDAALARSLEQGTVFCHPFVIGELACGTLRNRAEILALLRALPTVPQATEDEAHDFIAVRRLAGRGIGWIDMHLLASTSLAHSVRLWTRDRRLAKAAADLDLSV
jgi:predicted nucleic acid-binding protein